MTCLLISALSYKQVSFCGTYGAILVAFLCFLLVISLFEMTPSIVLKCHLVLLSSRKLYCALQIK